ncbi:MAG: hypothetical protein GWP91_24480 [Rhodobacterales bacterium]|nr:hypothetical protein [Rhodobacterales bacterium]
MITHPILDQLAVQGVRLGLDRIVSFLERIGAPHRAYPVVHVAGTNGKGSVCAMVTAILVDAGYQVGTTISPHIEHLNERIQINGLPVDNATLSEAIESIDRARWDWARTVGLEGTPLTYFEFMVAAAFTVFAQRQVDVAVVEVGLGGRLDATNVVEPLVCAIPSIGLDHTDQLGNTLAEVAGEKAGILKRGASVVVGPLAADARSVFQSRAKGLGSLLWAPPNLRREHRGGTTWSFATPEGALRDVKLNMEGHHQGANAMVALGVIHQLQRQGFAIEESAIRTGFARAIMPGRLERVLPGLVLDGAHNRSGAQALATWLGRQPRPGCRVLMLGMGTDRQPNGLVEILRPHFDEVVTTRCAHPKAWDPMDLALAMQDMDLTLAAGGPIEQALPEIYEEADETVVAGSLFIAGAARTLVKEGLLDGITPGQGMREE